jgi:RNA polymerase sigma-70 factor (ECF subfamily)
MRQENTNRLATADCRDSLLHKLSDEHIMLDVQQGKGDAFAVLFERYYRLVLVTALKIVRDAGEAEDVTQNVFLEVYRTAKMFDPARGSLKVWLLQYAYHRSINRRNYLVLRQFYQRPDLDEVSAWEAGTPPIPHIPVQEITQLVDQALGALNGPQRRTIQQVFFDGMTLKEVAEQNHESFSNVRNHYYRGLSRLRACLSRQPVALRKEREAILPFGEVRRDQA